MLGKRALIVACIAGCLGTVGRAYATPIGYSGTLTDGVPVVGSIAPGGITIDPEVAVYYSFFADAGSAVDLFGDRLDGDYDMGFLLYSGTFSDTTEFGGDLSLGAGLMGFSDDQDAPNIPGPFGDPHASFLAPVTGLYTVAVTNVLSGSDAGSNGVFDFTLTVTGIADSVAVPEPTSLALLGVGVAGFGTRVLRRRKASKI